MSGMQRTVLALAIIGALNWGLIGFFRFDLVAATFGGQAVAFSRIFYAIIGIAGLYCISILFKPSEKLEQVPHAQR